MNVAIVGEKGGGGKTTFATNLAGIRASRVRERSCRSVGHGSARQFAVLERRTCCSW